MSEPVALDFGAARLRLARAAGPLSLGAAGALPRPLQRQQGGWVRASLKRALDYGETFPPGAGAATEFLLERLRAVRAAAGAADRLAIVVPGNLPQRQRACLRAVALEVFASACLIEDVVAALRAAGERLAGAQRLAVLSWGASGCELARFERNGGLRMKDLAHGPDLGADALDAAAVDGALPRAQGAALEGLFEAARRTRERLLAHDPGAPDGDADSAARAQVRERIQRALARVDTMLAAATTGVDALVAVGGMACAPAVLRSLGERFPLVVALDADAGDLARGAAQQAATLGDEAWATRRSPVAEAAVAPVPERATSPPRPAAPPVPARATRTAVTAERARGGGGKVGRNEKCPCGSGLKYKKCHGR